MRSPRIRAGRPGSRARTVLTVAFALLLAAGVVALLRSTILSNAHALGDRLARSFATEEEARIQTFDFMLRYTASDVEAALACGADDGSIAALLDGARDATAGALGGIRVEPFVVVDGRTVSADGGVADAHPAPESEDWYRDARAAGASMVASDAYTSPATGASTLTLAMGLGDGAVLGMDVPSEELGMLFNRENLPTNGSYFLFDRAGQLIAYETVADVGAGVTDAYLDELRAAILSGRLTDEDATYAGLDGENRSIFHVELDNGWLSVITMPTADVLGSGWDTDIAALAAVCGALALVIFVLLVYDRVRTLRFQRISSTLQILGNTFYAIYLINYERGTYTTIKARPEIEQKLGPRGPYGDFLRTMQGLMDPPTFARFAESFSLESMARIAAERVPRFGGEYRRRVGDDVRWTSISLVADPDLSDHELILCFRFADDDIRERGAAIELLESSLAAARAAGRRKQIFFSNISHDMRTPLNAIIGMTRLLREHLDDPEDADRYLGLLEDAGEQLSQLVDDVLDISHSEHIASGVLHVAPVDLAALVERAVEPFREQARQEGKTIDLTLRAPRARVIADARRLRQILNNLVSNALKYSTAGARVSVSLEAEPRGAGDGRRTLPFRIVVADTGIGISREFLPRIFEPYVREETFAPHGITGTGLGLPIVKNLAEQMGGSISVESTLGEGSTFTVTIPFELADEPAADGSPVLAATEGAGRPLPPRAGSGVSRDSDPGALAGRRALVAEDNEANSLIVRALLESLGIEATCVTDGARAVEAFRASAPGTYDVVLMDMQMPVMDGCAATGAIRALDRADAATVPIIAVTASTFAEEMGRAAAAGMTGSVTKPLDRASLARAIGQALGTEGSDGEDLAFTE